VRGSIRATYLWDWTGAQADFDRALALDAGASSTQLLYADLLVDRGRISEALTAAYKVVDADPLSSDAWRFLGFCQQENGDLAASRRSLYHALQLTPQSDYARFALGRTEALDRHGQAALDAFRQIRFTPARLFGIALSEHVLGHPRESDGALKELVSRYAGSFAKETAELYAFRGETDKAFEWLDRAYAQHDGGIANLKLSPFLRNLHSDPRYEAMLVKMKMVD
jgi:tetratricopeptide (TPR) repeat protein